MKRVKRVKRDKKDRAYSKGYYTGVNGRSRDICPHNNTSMRQFWLTGWRDGRADSWSGLADFYSIMGSSKT